MKQFFKISITAMLTVLATGLYGCNDSDSDEPCGGDPPFYENPDEPKLLHSSGLILNGDFVDLRYHEECSPIIIALSKKAPDNPVSVVLRQAGTLEMELEGKTEGMDALTISGPMNIDDAQYIRDCAANHYLIMLDMHNASFENNVIPDRAFFKTYDYDYLSKSRDNPGTEPISPPVFVSVLSVPILNIRLPKDTEEIGERAFCAIAVTKLELPGSLRKAGSYCFENNMLSLGNFIIPEGVEEIQTAAFRSACSIGFYASDANDLGKLVIPSTVKTIEKMAFSRTSASEIIVSEGVERIRELAFFNSCAKIVRLPESLKQLDMGSLFALNNLQAIYCSNPNPPVVETGFLDKDHFHEYPASAFELVNQPSELTPTDVTVYVPEGSIAKYKKATGWSRFSNYKAL